MKAGDKLRLIRNKLGITTREVEDLSRRIAVGKENEDFFISNGWITKIENNEGNPSICKLYSLCAIYQMKFTDLMLLYDVDLDELSKIRLESPLSKTHLSDLTVYDDERSVTFPVRFDPGFNIRKSALLSRMVEAWAEVPLGLLQHLNFRNHLYGYIGQSDHSMSPLVRPGSFVQIDDTQTKIPAPFWTSEHDRPIYFIELREGYACSWCEMHGRQILLIPHPLSGYPVRQFHYPNEAEVVGRVTAVAMRLQPQKPASADSPAESLWKT